MSAMLPCQIQWFNNKVKGWENGLKRYSACSQKDGKRLICVQPKEGSPSDEDVQSVMIAACEQYCPYGMDTEKIMAARNAYVYVEGSEEQDEPTEPEPIDIPIPDEEPDGE